MLGKPAPKKLFFGTFVDGLGQVFNTLLVAPGRNQQAVWINRMEQSPEVFKTREGETLRLRARCVQASE